MLNINGTIETNKSNDDWTVDFIIWLEARGETFGGGTISVDNDGDEIEEEPICHVINENEFLKIYNKNKIAEAEIKRLKQTKDYLHKISMSVAMALYEDENKEERLLQIQAEAENARLWINRGENSYG